MSAWDLADPARQDLLDIWSYIAQDKPIAADRQIAKFENMFDNLADFPGQGTPVDKLRVGLFKEPSGPYVIYYVKSDYGVQIVRVLHGARKVRRSMFALPRR